MLERKEELNLINLFEDKITVDNIDTVNNNIDYLVKRYGNDFGNKYITSWFLNTTMLSSEKDLGLFERLLNEIKEDTHCTDYSASLKLKISRDICNDITDWYFYCEVLRHPDIFSPEVINKLWSHFKQFIYDSEGLLDLPAEIFSGLYNDNNYEYILFDVRYDRIILCLISELYSFKHQLGDKYLLEQIKAVFDNATDEQVTALLGSIENMKGELSEEIVEWLKGKLEEEPQAGTTSLFNH